MVELNDKALKVFALKYATRKTKSWRDKCMEIAKQIAEGGRPYGATDKQIEDRTQEYFEMLFEIMAIPGGRIIANAGTGIKNLANCFVKGIDDSRKSIYGALMDAAEIFADGGGCGYNFSHIREEGAEIKTTGGKASGPLSFMTLFDQTGEVISQASRRGAQMSVMNVSHPDIEKFIHYKSSLNHRNERLIQEYHRNLSVVKGGLKGTKYEKILEKTLMDDQLTHFNVSVMLTDDFMQAVKDGKDWKLISPSTGEVVKTVNAKDLLMSMAKQAWESGDPGELFYDAINNDNMVKYLEMIEATNPCFHPNTIIETVNGRMKISDITEPTKVYSVDKNGKLCLREATASWVTKKNVKTVVLKFNNNNSLTVTPEHKIMTVRRGWIRASELLLGEEVVSLCRARRGTKYSGIKLSTEDNRAYKMEHRWLYESFYNTELSKEDDVHHINGNTYENNIKNLEKINHPEHASKTRYSVPNNHQIKGEDGRWIESGNHGKKFPVQMPYNLRSDFLGKPRVISIEDGPITDVYDISVDDTHCLIADFVVAHNCGEVPLLTDESCILASLNLKKYYDYHDEDGINWALLKKNTKLLTRFLEDVVEVSEAPLEKINIKTKALRRLGLGIMGWADLLIDLNIPYDSDEAVELAEKVSWFINFHAWETSYELALERGAFKYYDPNEADLKVVTKVLYDTKYGNSEIPLYRLICDGVRNVAVVSIAPTGSIAIIGGVNGGPEPFFALVYKRNITEGVGNIAKDSIYEINPALESTLKARGYLKDTIIKIMDCVSETGTMAGCDMVDNEIQQLFKTANEIPWKRHVDMQAAWQKYTSNAISKTINLRQDATPQDIFDVYLYMWEKGLKGGTVYRNLSKSFQILEAPKGEK